MGYQKDDVRQMLQHQFGGVQNLANSVGQAHGGSRAGQHESAIQFWTLALEVLDEPDNGVSFDRVFAEAEIARHEAELAKLSPEPAPFPRNSPV